RIQHHLDQAGDGNIADLPGQLLVKSVAHDFLAGFWLLLWRLSLGLLSRLVGQSRESLNKLSPRRKPGSRCLI
ncbi:MAG TPA: hypothetical protein VFV18_02410, partial [Porticoccaceae bacterium]|nr:hypothetical protein [Porticoccaceae bacterium]